MTITVKEHLRELGYSNKKIASLLQTGKVFYQGVPTADHQRMIVPDEVVIRERAPRITVGRDPVLVHKDDGFVVVYKPAGYLSVRAPYRHRDPNILGFVYSLFGEAHAVHRLDEDTSGLMLVATKETVQKKLKQQLEQRQIERKYIAICGGYIQKAMIVDSILVRNRGDGKRGSRKNTSTEGQRAISHFTPLQRLHKATLLEARLETGRTHQIRIHLSEQNHAVLGDKLYGSRHTKNKSSRLALHACSLVLEHPKSEKELRFTAPLADDLERLRRKLSRSDKH